MDGTPYKSPNERHAIIFSTPDPSQSQGEKKVDARAAMHSHALMGASAKNLGLPRFCVG